MLSVKRITVTRDDNGAINTRCSGGRGHRAQDFEQSGTSLSCRTHTGHVCAHTRTHTQAHIRHACTRVCKHANTHTCAVCRHIHVDAQAQTHMHTHAMHMYTRMPRACTDMCTHQTHMLVHTRIHMYTHAVRVHTAHTAHAHTQPWCFCQSRGAPMSP